MRKKQGVCRTGLRLLTMVVLLAGNQRLHHVQNQRQLTKYAGLDVEKQDSGTSVHKPGRLSKKGNRHPQSLHASALTHPQGGQRQEFFKRLVSKHGVKMRKPLLLSSAKPAW